MKIVPQYRAILLALLAAGAGIRAETTPGAAVDAATNATPPVAESSPTNRWSFSASLATYLVHNDSDYLQPTLAADRDWLHLEFRYNYEALDAGSLWIGYNFSWGEKLTLDLTPMCGGVFGDMTGFAPGYQLTLGYGKLELYSEGEYVFDTERSSDDFFYNWSSLTFSPVEWVRAGMVTQRTRIEGKDRDIQRGPLIGFTYRRTDVTVYSLDPGSDHWTLVFSVALNF